MIPPLFAAPQGQGTCSVLFKAGRQPDITFTTIVASV
uniref:Uncharacterized protein n=1 Tax=Anguilla anguilla TaxID=7936 RepID=A0A0E9PUJ4_ANGAN